MRPSATLAMLMKTYRTLSNVSNSLSMSWKLSITNQKSLPLEGMHYTNLSHYPLIIIEVTVKTWNMRLLQKMLHYYMCLTDLQGVELLMVVPPHHSRDMVSQKTKYNTDNDDPVCVVSACS